MATTQNTTADLDITQLSERELVAHLRYLDTLHDGSAGASAAIEDSGFTPPF